MRRLPGFVLLGLFSWGLPLFGNCRVQLVDYQQSLMGASSGEAVVDLVHIQKRKPISQATDFSLTVKNRHSLRVAHAVTGTKTARVQILKIDRRGSDATPAPKITKTLISSDELKIYVVDDRGGLHIFERIQPREDFTSYQFLQVIAKTHPFEFAGSRVGKIAEALDDVVEARNPDRLVVANPWNIYLIDTEKMNVLRRETIQRPNPRSLMLASVQKRGSVQLITLETKVLARLSGNRLMVFDLPSLKKIRISLPDLATGHQRGPRRAYVTAVASVKNSDHLYLFTQGHEVHEYQSIPNPNTPEDREFQRKSTLVSSALATRQIIDALYLEGWQVLAVLTEKAFVFIEPNLNRELALEFSSHPTAANQIGGFKEGSLPVHFTVTLHGSQATLNVLYSNGSLVHWDVSSILNQLTSAPSLPSSPE